MRREHNDGVFAVLWRELFESLTNVFRDGLDETSMRRPPIDHTPLDLSVPAPRQSTLDQLFLTSRLVFCLGRQHLIRRRARLLALSRTGTECGNAHQLVQTASRRGTAVLRVLRERDRPSGAIALHLLETRLRQGFRITEHDVWLVRCRFRVELVEEGAHCCSLRTRPSEDRGTAADFRVLFFNLGCAAFGDDGCEVVLEG